MAHQRVINTDLNALSRSLVISSPFNKRIIIHTLSSPLLLTLLAGEGGGSPLLHNIFWCALSAAAAHSRKGKQASGHFAASDALMDDTIQMK
jgi:hypothetical protein